MLDEIVGRPDAEADELLGLNDALAHIPENQRRAIVLREWHGLRYREIAATMGVTQTAVEMLVFRARRSLAGALRGERRATVGARVRRALDAGSMLALVRAAIGSVSSAQVAAGAGMLAVIAAGGGAPDRPAPGHGSSRLPAVGIAGPAMLRGSEEPIVRLQTASAQRAVHVRPSGPPVADRSTPVHAPTAQATDAAGLVGREPPPAGPPAESPAPREPGPLQIPVEAPQIAVPVAIPPVTLPPDVAPVLTADALPVAVP